MVTLAPFDLGDLLGGVLRTWVSHWRLVLALSALLAVTGGVLGLPFTRQTMLASSAPPGRPEQFWDTAGPQVITAVTLIPLSVAGWAVLTGVATGLFAVVGRQAVLGRRPTWSQVWRHLGPSLPRLALLSLVVYLVAGLALLFCVVPGIIVYTLWSLAIPALVTERLTVGQALRRSFRLVRGDAWRVFAVLAVVVVATAAAGAALSIPLSSAVQFAMDPSFTETGWGFVLASTASGLPAGIVTAAILPLTALMLYVDQRIRRERYDLQLAQEAADPRA